MNGFPDMNGFSNFMFNHFDMIFGVVFIIAAGVVAIGFIFTILQLVSPRFRGKMMSRQVKAAKHMMDYAKEDLEDIGVTASEVGINIQEEVLDRNEQRMKSNADRTAHVYEDALRTTASAVGEGLSGGRKIYCKHCGAKIDPDSRFCRFCGKEQ